MHYVAIVEYMSAARGVWTELYYRYRKNKPFKTKSCGAA